MERLGNDPLVSLDVSMRQREREKQKTQQQKEMDNRRVAAPQSAWNQSVSATTDIHMRDALNQVRQSDVTHNEDLLRLQGTWMWNKK